jgi:hypothetical protein
MRPFMPKRIRMPADGRSRVETAEGDHPGFPPPEILGTRLRSLAPISPPRMRP